MSKKVVSVSLFGNKGYDRYLKAFVLAHLNLFSNDEDWHLVAHIDDVISETKTGRFLWALHHAQLVEVTTMGEAIYTRAMLWRMRPVFQEGVDYVFCRDLDCVPMPRDRACCDQFIASGATVHTIHDNALHFAIMGGLCGFHAPRFCNETGFHSLDELLTYGDDHGANWRAKGTDQNLLNHLCLRSGGPTLFEHRYHGWNGGPGREPPRAPTVYPCRTISEPVPSSGPSRLSVVLGQKADLLARHLGGAGFDWEAAEWFWKKHGMRHLTDAVEACDR